MFKNSRILFLYCETPLHAGIGAGLGGVDLPIQRERATDYPMIQSSGVKGALRSAMPRDPRDPKKSHPSTEAIFGPELQSGTAHAPDSAGMLVVGDARLLAFPVRSLQGVFAYITCLDVLARFQRDAADISLPGNYSFPSSPPDREKAYVVQTAPNYSPVIAANNLRTLYLEEFEFSIGGESADTAADWLSQNALPTSYTHWQNRMKEALVIVHDDVFRDFTRFSTEVQTRVALLPDTKTVKRGALWTEESLPAETLMYVPIRATDPRKNGVQLDEAINGTKALNSQTAIQWVEKKAGERLQIGGDETISRGIVGLRWL